MPVVKSKKIEIIESLRGFAAIYVVIHHFIGFTDLKNSLPSFIHLPFRFGQEIVMLFFLMSGFVIYTANKSIETKTFNEYIKKRFLRIYPIFLLTLLLSIIVLFLNNEHFNVGDEKDFVGNLLMLQDTGNKPGAIVFPFLKNYPLWSLSYEWWFYVIFFPLSVIIARTRFLKKNASIYLVLLISTVSYIFYLITPNHLLLILSHLVIWWSGVYIAQLFFELDRLSFKALRPVYISLFVMTLISSIPVLNNLVNGVKVMDVNDYPIIDFRHYASALLLIIVGNILYSANFNKLQVWLSPFARLAPISYALYCIHFPIIHLKVGFIQNVFVEFLFKLSMVLAISYFFERILQPYIVKIKIKQTRSKLKVINDY